MLGALQQNAPMHPSVQIRNFRRGDEPALFAVYHSAIHQIASRDYSAEQIQAWAPDDLDAGLWANRMQGIKPFVAESGGTILGYADLQDSGYIDHFFVSGEHPRRGIGSMLMNHILETAKQRGLAELTSDVSRTAQPFYAKFGFEIVEQRLPERRGVVIPNALMRRKL